MMDKRKVADAELVALSQHHQTKKINEALSKLEWHQNKVHTDTLRQSDQLTSLDAQITELYAIAGLKRTEANDIATVNILSSLKISEEEKIAICANLPDLSVSLNIPQSNGDWYSYMQEVDRYIANHSIDLKRDPFEQLVRPHQMAAVYHRFQDDFGDIPWDKFDYSAVGLAVILSTLIDYFIVAIPSSMNFKGKEYKGSPITGWMREQSEKIISGKGNAFQCWLYEIMQSAEKYAKVPYDISNNSQIDGEVPGLRPDMHRLMSPGHDPIVGIIFGVIDILKGNCTLIDRNGMWHVITPEMRTGNVSAINNPIQALMMVFAHLFSDIFTSAGIPVPFMTVLQSFNFNTGISVKENGIALNTPDLIRYMYSYGYDLRHFMTMSIVPMVAELMIRTYHSIRMYDPAATKGRSGIRGKMKLAKLLTSTHSLLVSTNILKVALYGCNPTAFNWAQSLAFGKQLFSLLMLLKEKDKLIEQQLLEGWQEVLAGAHT